MWPHVHHVGFGTGSFKLCLFLLQAGESVPPSDAPAAAQTFPARYLGWMPVTEDKLVTGQCVRAVHNCISKMVASKDVESKVCVF